MAKQEELKKKLELANQILLKQDVTSAFKVILEVVAKTKEAFVEALQDIKARQVKGQQELRGNIESVLKNELSSFEAKFEKLHKDQSNDLNFIKDKARKLKDGYTPVKGVDYFDGEDGKPGKDADPKKVAKLVRDMIKLPDIPTVEELKRQIAVDDVQGLEEFTKKQITARMGGTRRIYQPYRDNFTADTDGSTKTFYLSREPLKTDTIMVWGTDYPIILDPATDFTVSGKALTLTSAVPAPSSGATLVVIYFA